MSLTVMFDRILGRLRETDGGSTPAPSHTFTATTIGDNKTYFADERETDSLTVTVTTRYDGNLVDCTPPDQTWTRTAQGTYTKTISGNGTIAAATFTYTPQGGSAMTATSQARTLTKVYPAYWGIYPSNDLLGDSSLDISAIVANLETQHRETSSFSNRTVEEVNSSEASCWFWIVTHNTANAEPAMFPGYSILEPPVTGKTFVSPLANLSLTGYNVYISTNSIKAGESSGQIKLTINL